MNNILITGGAGFIGSHICLNLLEDEYNVFIADSFINSSRKVFDGIRGIINNKNNKFNSNRLNIFEGDIRDENFLSNIFEEASKKGMSLDGVIHCAGLKSVRESFYNPLGYWDNNVKGSINLFKVMDNNNCRTILFSSSATVYGKLNKIPFKENAILNPINPYGETKVAVEKILDNLYESLESKWRIGYLRYFNPIGAHPSGLIGENPPRSPENIFPYICQVASGFKDKLYVFGKDWPTSDGTCHRDFLHIVDLAVAHKKSIGYLLNKKSTKLVLNIGTGKSRSVLDLIETFEKVNKIKINYEFTSRRDGDVAVSLASTSRLSKILNWKPKRSLEDMCRDGWLWQKNHK